MKLYSLFSIVLIGIICSCNGKESPAMIVDETRKTYYLDDMVKDYSLLTLKDDSVDGLVGRINKVLIDDDLIFLSHFPNEQSGDLQQQLGVYDLKGNYLHGIGHTGRAFNEYQAVRDWSIDIINKEVLVYDPFRNRIQKYSYDGSFKSSITLNNEILRANQLYCNNSRIYIQSMIPNESSDDITRILNDGTKVPLMPKRKLSTEDFYIAGVNQLSNPSNDTLYHIRPLDNNLYKIIDQDCSKMQTLDFILIPSARKMKKFTTDDYDYLIAMPPYCYDTKSYFFVQTIKDGLYVFSKNEIKWTHYIEKDQINATIIIPNSIVGVSEDKIIGQITTMRARDELRYNQNLTENEKVVFEQILKSENPTLVFYNLK